MINREIVYERNMTGSYMKIPAGIHAGLDERLMLRRKIPGLLPVEKTYVDGAGQYWYNISGRQSLDVYCKVREIGIDFMERLIVSICSEMEILEWNLIHSSCLCLDPELIYVTNSNQEFIFTVYPGESGSVEKDFQQLMEYLLTKINHKDAKAVQTAYRIYERSLEEGFSIMDLRGEIMDAKRQKNIGEPQVEKQKEEEPAEHENKTKIHHDAKKKKEKERIPAKKDKITLGERIRRKLVEWGMIEPEMKKKTKAQNQIPAQTQPVYPEEEIEPEPIPEIRPTICLSSCIGKERGLLLYQGADQLEDIVVNAASIQIGHGRDADIQIDRDTVSQLHARIDREEDAFYIEDLNSTNGTFVNDEPLAYKERRRLKANDIVRFADIRYRFT